MLYAYSNGDVGYLVRETAKGYLELEIVERVRTSHRKKYQNYIASKDMVREIRTRD